MMLFASLSSLPNIVGCDTVMTWFSPWAGKVFGKLLSIVVGSFRSSFRSNPIALDNVSFVTCRVKWSLPARTEAVTSFSISSRDGVTIVSQLLYLIAAGNFVHSDSCTSTDIDSTNPWS